MLEGVPQPRFDAEPQKGEGGGRSVRKERLEEWEQRVEQERAIPQRELSVARNLAKRVGIENSEELEPKQLVQAIRQAASQDPEASNYIQIVETPQPDEGDRPASVEELQRLADLHAGRLSDEEADQLRSGPPVEAPPVQVGPEPPVAPSTVEEVTADAAPPASDTLGQESVSPQEDASEEDGDIDEDQIGRTEPIKKTVARQSQEDGSRIEPTKPSRRTPEPPPTQVLDIATPTPEAFRAPAAPTAAPRTPDAPPEEPTPEQTIRAGPNDPEVVRVFEDKLGNFRDGFEFEDFRGEKYKVVSTKFMEVLPAEAEELRQLEQQRGIRAVLERNPHVDVQFAIQDPQGNQSLYGYAPREEQTYLKDLRELLFENPDRAPAAVLQQENLPHRDELIANAERERRETQERARQEAETAAQRQHQEQRIDFSQMSETERAEKVEELKARIEAAAQGTEQQPGDSENLVALRRDLLRGGGERFWGQVVDLNSVDAINANEKGRFASRIVTQGDTFESGGNTYRIDRIGLTGRDLDRLTAEQQTALLREVNENGFQVIGRNHPGLRVTTSYELTDQNDQSRVIPGGAIVPLLMRHYSEQEARRGTTPEPAPIAPEPTPIPGTPENPPPSDGGPTATAGVPENGDRNRTIYQQELAMALEDPYIRGGRPGATRELIGEDVFRRIWNMQNLYLATHRPEVLKDPSYDPMQDPITQAILSLRSRGKFASAPMLTRAILMLEGMKADYLGDASDPNDPVREVWGYRLAEIKELQDELNKNMRAEPRRGLVGSMTEFIKRKSPLTKARYARAEARAAALDFDYDLLNALQSGDFSKTRIDAALRKNLGDWENNLIASRATGRPVLLAGSGVENLGVNLGAAGTGQTTTVEGGGGPRINIAAGEGQGNIEIGNLGNVFVRELIQEGIRSNFKFTEASMQRILAKFLADLGGIDPALADQIQEKGRGLSFLRWGKKAASVSLMLLLVSAVIIGLSTKAAFEQKQ